MIARARPATLVAVAGFFAGPALAQAPAITEFTVSPQGYVGGVVAGPDGALWFTNDNSIGRITTTGTATQFTLPSANSQANEIAVGPDGAFWFTDSGTNEIGRITTGGAVTEFPIPTPNSDPRGITAGPDGALWFIETNADQIGRITTKGVVTEFPIPTASAFPQGITAGPDGALWFTEVNGLKVGRIATTGAITEFTLPTGVSAGPITTGPDGALWFGDACGDELDRITTSGAVSRFPVSRTLTAVTTGPDGALWFLEGLFDGCGGFGGPAGLNPVLIGRLTLAGVLTEFPAPTPAYFGLSGPGIATGPDGNLWFSDSPIPLNQENIVPNPPVAQIGRIVPTTLPPSPLLASVLPSSRAVEVGATATAFATIINTAATPASDCGISLVSKVPTSFLYQTTNPTTNALTGSPNTPVTIPGSTSTQLGLQTFVIALTPSAAIVDTELAFAFACASGLPAPVFFDTSTLDLVGSSTPTPDIVALAATQNNDGIVDIPGATGTGVFAVATVNLGVGASIQASAFGPSNTQITICQTSASGNCLAPPAASVNLTINPGDEPTFGIFVTGSSTVPFLPATNRVNVFFGADNGFDRVGSTSVAVRTQ
jgi:virginiamycin B lyase